MFKIKRPACFVTKAQRAPEPRPVMWLSCHLFSGLLEIPARVSHFIKNNTPSAGIRLRLRFLHFNFSFHLLSVECDAQNSESTFNLIL